MRRNFFIQSHVDFFNIRHAAAEHNNIWIENINEHGKGARQTVYVLDKGQPKAIAIQTGVSDGSMTEVVGGALQPGMLVITGQLASGTN